MSKRKRIHDEGDADGVERKFVKRHRIDRGANSIADGDTRHKNVSVQNHGQGRMDDRVTDSKAARRAARRQRRKEEREEEAANDDAGHKHVLVQDHGQDHNENRIFGSRAARKAAKRQRRKERREQEADGVVEAKKRKKKERANKHENEKSQKRSWKVSEAVGGQMLNADPLFSPDEEYLLLAFDSTINVYSTSTSILVRRLRLHRAEAISSFDFSSANSNHLFVATMSGTIHKWDWINGKFVELWNTKTPIYSIKSSGSTESQGESGLVYTLDQHTKERWLVTAHRLVGGEEAGKTALVTLLTYDEPLTSLKVLEEGRVIVATAGSKMLIGTTKRPSEPSLKDVTYTWREFDCSTRITCIDVQISSTTATSKPSEKSKAAVNPVNIVTGCVGGSIFVYEDVLEKLVRKENRSNRPHDNDLDPRKLHWHRNAVASVKWSADGNYIISGGQETVLVIWQLDTGSRQDLPHLSAAIENIVVSPDGSSYAVRLADNSAMILSTSELQPTFSTAGIQVPGTTQSTTQHPLTPTIDAPNKSSQTVQYRRVPATISSLGANRLLFAVPAMTSSDASKQACYLQTVDFNSGQQITRQALTRTNITTLNIGPEKGRIEEPSVTLMAISHDGQWLATVDEWEPPQRDLTHLAFDDARAEEERRLRLEIYLKFWSWDETSNTWALVARIDNSHTAPSGRPCKVLDLASDPSCVGFATVGEDGAVRIWQPTIRRRHGVEVRGKDGSSLTNWTCRQTTELRRLDTAQEKEVGKLAFSADGSVLAAAIQSSPPSSNIHLIDPSTAAIRSNPPNLYSGRLHGLGILHKYLITLSNEIRVWDMVTSELAYGFSLEVPPTALLARSEVHATTHLALSHTHQTFAIAIPESNHHHRNSGVQSRLIIFDPTDPTPLYAKRFSVPITNLLATPTSGSYHLIDAAAELRTLRQSQFLPPPAPAPPSTEPNSNLKDIYGAKAVLGLENMNFVQEEGGGGGEEGARVVRAEELARVFESHGYMLPPVGELFEAVAKLFAGKEKEEEGE
ncbi:MAG: hypothetical protein Q9191_006837 [Dirinaria sp. TL-2023a]